MNTDGLIERIWNPADEPELTKSIFGGNIEEWHNYDTAYALYANSEKPVIIQKYLYISYKLVEYGDSNKFSEYFSSFNIANYQEILFALDTYFLNMLSTSKENIHPKHYSFSKQPLIDSFLQNSNGAILWNYQLNDLFMLYLTENTEAAEYLTRSYNNLGFSFFSNSDKVNALHKVKQILIDENITLHDVITERMIYQKTFEPNIRRAKTMFEFFNSTKI